MERELITTADGSHSLYVKGLDEHYHSIHGAIQESKHVFIETGLKHIFSKGVQQINILEIGFGTGLNALLTLMEAEKLNIKVNYTSLEAYPLNSELVNALNYVDLLSKSESLVKVTLADRFNQLHNSDWEKEIVLSENFILHKIKNTLQEIIFNKNFDLI